MQRYSVTIVSPGATGERSTLLIPFKPSSAVLDFINELWKRVARQKLSLAPHTHLATLHIDSETGAILDQEDNLGDVVHADEDKIFAVFASKDASQPPVLPLRGAMEIEDTLNIRIITPALCKDRSACPVVSVPLNSTIRQLHDRVATHLHIQPLFDDDVELLECNCNLARQLADGTPHRSDCFVVHGKSTVERLNLTTPTEPALKAALRARFGVDVENKKKVELRGAEMQTRYTGRYKKPPVIAVCSKQRHLSQLARTDIDETGQRKFKTLDLHTSEQPIHPGCMNATISDAGLVNLAVDGVIDIFAVDRTTTGNAKLAVGKSSIFRSRACWEPNTIQSDRGMAMFLSSLRVFASLVQNMRKENRAQDAVLHAFDLLTHGFSPALRTLHILIQGKTPTEVECSALSHTLFSALDSFLPTDVVGTDHSRVFEGSRLLWAFILDKAKILKLPKEEGIGLPYTAAFQTIDVRDHRTHEVVSQAVQTSKGLVEASLFKAFHEGGLLFETDVQPFLVESEIDTDIFRRILLGGGAVAELTVLSRKHLNANYRYPDAGNVHAAIDVTELADLNHLADLCGINKLAVYKPRQLVSAVAPCLTFDRNAHLAVYTGEQACADPGHSSMIFRPLHGEEVIDTAIVEQLISPILQSYEADGTAAFCALGGGEVRRMETPDELLMFCVDTSASMRNPTDFQEVNADEDSIENVQVEPEFYSRAVLEDVQERLCGYESFDDMVAIVFQAPEAQRRPSAMKTLRLLKMILSAEIGKLSEILNAAREFGRHYHNLQYSPNHQTDLDELKTFWAGLTTHEQAICDLLIYRANSDLRDIAQQWTWSIGDAPPALNPAQQIPTLDASITEIPDHLRCPISRCLMLDAVTAADGHTYSKAAIQTWFGIRHSSPKTGLDLASTELAVNQNICDAATLWVDGDGIPAREGGESKRLRPSMDVEITFNSKVGSFIRHVPSTISAADLHRLVFRGLKARYSIFQLATEQHGTLSAISNTALSGLEITSGQHVSVRIAQDDPVPQSTSAVSSPHSDLVLIKVYGGIDLLLFAYWVKKDAASTIASVIWKYWRHELKDATLHDIEAKAVWTGMEYNGDNLLSGIPRKTTERLSNLFNMYHCFGILGHEPVYKQDAVSVLPLVLKVKIMGPKDELKRHNLSRLDVLKQMFEALANKILAYGFKTHLGLVTFNSTAQVVMGMSHVLENFRRATNDMTAKHDTSLWDALALCKDQLVEYGKKYPNAKKRIICISDGVDTKSSSNTSEDVCWQLHKAGVAVDSVSLGYESNQDLRALSIVLGSYHFHPHSLVNALTMCEMEPFLSLTERPAISVPRPIPASRFDFTSFFRAAKYWALGTEVTLEKVPPRKSHPNLCDDFVELSAIVKRRSERTTTSVSAPRSNFRTTRLLSELRQLASREHDTYDVYVSEKDMSFMKVVMSGPDDTPYEDGTFLLYIHADERYPIFAPKGRFVTKIMHPNVNVHGRICHSIFDRDWTSDISLGTILDTCYGLLMEPEQSDGVNTTTTLGYHHDQDDFAEAVREHVGHHASKSREEWRKEILGVDASDEDQVEDEEEDEE